MAAGARSRPAAAAASVVYVTTHVLATHRKAITPVDQDGRTPRACREEVVNRGGVKSIRVFYIGTSLYVYV